MIKPIRFSRRPFFVDAIQVSEENLSEVSEWCGGQILTMATQEGDVKYVKVPAFRPTPNRRLQAFPGTWVVRINKSFKVYTAVGFHKAFVWVEPQPPSA